MLKLWVQFLIDDRQSDFMLHEFSSSTNARSKTPCFIRLSGSENHAEGLPAKLTENAVPLNRNRVLFRRCAGGQQQDCVAVACLEAQIALDGIQTVHAVDQLAIGNRFVQCAFVQASELGGVGKSLEPVKGCFDRLAILKQFVAG